MLCSISSSEGDYTEQEEEARPAKFLFQNVRKTPRRKLRQKKKPLQPQYLFKTTDKALKEIMISVVPLKYLIRNKVRNSLF